MSLPLSHVLSLIPPPTCTQLSMIHCCIVLLLTFNSYILVLGSIHRKVYAGGSNVVGGGGGGGGDGDVVLVVVGVGGGSGRTESILVQQRVFSSRAKVLGSSS